MDKVEKLSYTLLFCQFCIITILSGAISFYLLRGGVHYVVPFMVGMQQGRAV